MTARSGRPPAFHERFNIDIGTKKAKQNFVNRAHNMIFEGYISGFGDYSRNDFQDLIINHLGLRRPLNEYEPLTLQIGLDSYDNLRAVEGTSRLTQLIAIAEARAPSISPNAASRETTGLAANDLSLAVRQLSESTAFSSSSSCFCLSAGVSLSGSNLMVIFLIVPVNWLLHGL
jgi:hypothetical protein